MVAVIEDTYLAAEIRRPAALAGTVAAGAENLERVRDTLLAAAGNDRARLLRLRDMLAVGQLAAVVDRRLMLAWIDEALLDLAAAP